MFLTRILPVVLYNVEVKVHKLYNITKNLFQNLICLAISIKFQEKSCQD